MATNKRKRSSKKKSVETSVIVKTEITALTAIALFLAAIPLAIMIGVWTAMFAIAVVKY